VEEPRKNLTVIGGKWCTYKKADVCNKWHSHTGVWQIGKQVDSCTTATYDLGGG